MDTVYETKGKANPKKRSRKSPFPFREGDVLCFRAEKIDAAMLNRYFAGPGRNRTRFLREAVRQYLVSKKCAGKREEATMREMGLLKEGEL